MTIIHSIKRRLNPRHALLGALALSAIVGYGIHAARAGGIPATGALVYSGLLSNASGAPLASPQDVEVGVWDKASVGTQQCLGSFPGTTLDSSGRFQVTMPDTCAGKVGGNPDLWVEVKVGTTILGRTKIGAVPYAIEANHAVTAGKADDSALLNGSAATDFQKRVVPAGCAANSSIRVIGADGSVTCEADDNTSYTGATGLVPAGMIGIFATACPTGWAVCDGTSGRPNLVGAYPKGGTAFAAQTGLNTHSHTEGTYTASAAGDHYHVAYLDWESGRLAGSFTGTGVFWNSTHSLTSGTLLSAPDGGFSSGSGIVTTTAGSHTHAVTGVSQTVNHEPTHATVVFCMKN